MKSRPRGWFTRYYYNNTVINPVMIKHSDVYSWTSTFSGCKSMSLQNGYVCYEWSTSLGIWESSLAKLVCNPSYKLNTTRNKIDCKKKPVCRVLAYCYSWDYQATPACDEEGISTNFIFTRIASLVRFLILVLFTIRNNLRAFYRLTILKTMSI